MMLGSVYRGSVFDYIISECMTIHFRFFLTAFKVLWPVGPSL